MIAVKNIYIEECAFGAVEIYCKSPNESISPYFIKKRVFIPMLNDLTIFPMLNDLTIFPKM